MKYLKLIRYQNLIIVALTQVFIRFCVFIPLGADITLTNFQFALLVFATLCIAASGNIINDIYDVEIDAINKPDKVTVGKTITENTANYLFIAFNVIGVGLGYYICNKIGKPEFLGFFIATSALLYLYASFLKSILLFGNIIISILVAFSLIIVGLFDLFPAINFLNNGHQSYIFSIVLSYAFFAFYINLMREIVKDIQDINGDKKGEIHTLPIAIGRKRTSLLVFSLGVFALFGIIYYLYIHLYNNQTAVIYFLIFVIAPLLYFCVKIWDAKSKNDYAFLSKLLKIIMFLGICSMLLYPFTMNS